MGRRIWEKLSAWMAAPIERRERSGGTMYQRLATPYTFKPQLSLGEASIAVLAAFLRIFLGSLLFGVYGWYALIAWFGIRSYWVRLAAIPVAVAVFLILLLLLMAGISGFVRFLLQNRLVAQNRGSR